MNDRDRARRLSAVLFDSLDAAVESPELARRAWQSRSGFFRLFQALVEETPGGMRRRLLLERAAWQLRETSLPVTEAALNSGYGSLEAFTRAFRKAFGMSPSLYRRTRPARIHLPAPNGFHFQPPQTHSKGNATNMDLFDLFAGADSWYIRRMLQQAASLADEQLDRPVDGAVRMFGWDRPDKSLREILERMVLTREVWTAALTGGSAPELYNPPAETRTPAALLDRFEKADAGFNSVLRDVRDRGAWNDTFVDALCEPAETFTFGGMFAHIVTFNTGRRLAALDAFERLGAPVEGTGCPMDYEACVASTGF